MTPGFFTRYRPNEKGLKREKPMHQYIEPLSERELEVLQWLASGDSNREIGRRLYIAESTVKRHVYNIFGKLNVCNRTQAALAHSLDSEYLPHPLQFWPESRV